MVDVRHQVGAEDLGPGSQVERPVDPARHVWVQTPSGRQAGLLVAWVPGADGTWWGRVAVSDAPGEASLQLLAGRLLSPAQQEAEEPGVRGDQPG